jgi:Asp-tRNA(Asn)/Glu-tRNA(Gln) amidotransferase A subunit family amidase
VSFWAGNVGTETSGSILSPANQNMLAGIADGRARQPLRRIPITADQDTAGPMAKTVGDVAIMLGALEGAAPTERSGDARLHAAGTRLHEVPQPRAGRAARYIGIRAPSSTASRFPATPESGVARPGPGVAQPGPAAG